MGTKYTSQATTGYNSSPPPDDGSTVAANKITWATIKSKLSDVLKTFGEAINSALVTALDTSATTTSIAYTTLASDHLKPIEATGTFTISLGDAATMAAGYQAPVFNKGTGLITVTPITPADTLNGTAAASVVLPPWTGMTFAVNQAANGYDIISASSPYRQGADIASATTTALRNATGDYVNVTGTTTITGITLDKGQEKTVQFSGALILTNGASLILPGGANITTAAGDTAIFRGEAAGVVRCVSYARADGTLLSAPTATVASAATVNLQTAGADYVSITGTTQINAVTLNNGHSRMAFFNAALILQSSASLVLPGGQNITTAAGDIAVFRGESAGVVRLVLYQPAAAAFAAFKAGTFTRDISLATGTQAVTGVGFKPRAIDFFATAAGQAGATSWGFSDGTSNQSIYDDYQTLANTYNQTANAILLQTAVGSYITAIISSFDADGFTLSVTKVGTPTGTATIKYKAYR